MPLLGKDLHQILRNRSDVDGLLEQIRWAQAFDDFDDIEVECRGGKATPPSVRLWGRALPHNGEAVYEIVVQERDDYH